MNDESRSVPVPDPTKLTTDAVNAAVDVSRRELEAAVRLLGARMDGMDDVEREKICRFTDKFKTIESQRLEQKADVKAAVDAALAAQKEAIGKSEAATKEQIVSLGTNAQTANEALRRDIDDLKSRVTIVEAMKTGAIEQKEKLTAGAQLGIAVLGLLVAILSIAVVVILSNGAGPG
jgi:hypothetical protein